MSTGKAASLPIPVIPVARNDHHCMCRNRCGNDLIVIGITRHNASDRFRLDQMHERVVKADDGFGVASGFRQLTGKLGIGKRVPQFSIKSELLNSRISSRDTKIKKRARLSSPKQRRNYDIGIKQNIQPLCAE